MKFVIKSIIEWLLLKGFMPKSLFFIDVDITGGFGSQIISLYAAKCLKEMGYKVSLNLKYFTKEYFLDDGVSRFVLHPFVENKIWHAAPRSIGQMSMPLHDGVVKFELGLRFILKYKEEIFREFSRYADLVQKPSKKPKIIVHVRRGDFVKVADYILPISDQISMISNVLMENADVIFLTDSPDNVREEIDNCRELKTHLTQVEILGPDKLSIDETFFMMMTADILIASNSQLSLIASCLNPNLKCMLTEKYVKDPRYKNIMKKNASGIGLWQD